LKLDCPDQYKVALTTYQFEGEVEYWWDSKIEKTLKPHDMGKVDRTFG